jgi:hypothetical protein
MFTPGDLVVPKLRFGIRKLFLWSNKSELGPCEVSAEVAKNTIMTILRIESYGSNLQRINKEWEQGACLILAQNGKLGWVGSGWLKKLPSSSHA